VSLGLASGIQLEETVIRQTGDVSVHTLMEMNARATMSTARTGAPPRPMVTHADGHGQLQILTGGIQVMQRADVI